MNRNFDCRRLERSMAMVEPSRSVRERTSGDLLTIEASEMQRATIRVA